MRDLFSALYRIRAFEALRYRNYRLISYGQISSNVGTWMDEVTRGWLIYHLTNSALDLGLVKGVQLLPLLFLSPVAGSVADRYSRKKILLITQSINGAVFASMAFLIFTNLILPWHVYVTAVIVGLMQAFQQPARSAMVSDTVPLEYLTNAIGLNALLFNLARIVGPALAGATIALVGTGGSFTIQSIFLLLATVWTVQIQYTKKSDPIAKEPKKYSLKSNIIEGWRFALATKAVHAGLLCNMIVSLFIVPFTTLLPVFARDILGVGAQGQGFLLTAMGVGALISSCVIAISGHKMVRGQVMLISSLFYGLVVVLFSVSSWFSFSAFVMILVGLCHVHANALVNTIVQTYSPAHFRGRTMALFNMSQLLSTAGSMVIGSLAQTLGPQIAVASMGLMGALSIGMMYYLMPYAKSVK